MPFIAAASAMTITQAQTGDAVKRQRVTIPNGAGRCRVVNSAEGDAPEHGRGTLAGSRLMPHPASMSDRDPVDVVARLQAQRDRFRAFLSARLGSEADAEDLLQQGMVKALERAGEIRDEEKLTAWFYRLLRNTMIDHVRSRAAAARREHAWTAETQTLADDPEAMGHLCACFERLLPHLKPLHGELIRRVELGGEPVRVAADALGLTPNHASVTLHRAREELRTKLMHFCGDCSCLAACSCE